MKWGILATGTIAKKFASTVEQMGAEGEQLVAVGSRHMESAQAFAQQYGIPRCYDSYEALAADPEVEAIYIATPNTLPQKAFFACGDYGIRRATTRNLMEGCFYEIFCLQFVSQWHSWRRSVPR